MPSERVQQAAAALNGGALGAWEREHGALTADELTEMVTNLTTLGLTDFGSFLDRRIAARREHEAIERDKAALAAAVTGLGVATATKRWTKATFWVALVGTLAAVVGAAAAVLALLRARSG